MMLAQVAGPSLGWRARVAKWRLIADRQVSSCLRQQPPSNGGLQCARDLCATSANPPTTPCHVQSKSATCGEATAAGKRPPPVCVACLHAPDKASLRAGPGLLDDSLAVSGRHMAGAGMLGEDLCQGGVGLDPPPSGLHVCESSPWIACYAMPCFPPKPPTLERGRHAFFVVGRGSASA